jgi:carboxyl-terminal processing protease
VTKADYALDPISDRYGAKIITEGGRNYGYLNLRTFISSANPQLRTAFLNFRNQGVTDIIVDFRYNGGGLVSTAELMGDLLGANRTSSCFRRPISARRNRPRTAAVSFRRSPNRSRRRASPLSEPARPRPRASSSSIRCCPIWAPT